MFKNNKKGIINLAIIIVLLFAIVGLTLAFFSDTVTLTEKGTAGTVALELKNNINLLDGEGNDSLVPGDMRSAAFEVVNVGNKSVDIKTTISVSVFGEFNDLEFSGDATTQSEFELYHASDVEYQDGVGYVFTSTPTPIGTKIINSYALNEIIYEIAPITINGNSAMYDEYETVNGVNAYSHLYDYVLLFKNDTPDTWENCYVEITIVIEAKQHENSESGWEVIDVETITTGSTSHNTVVGENVITDDNGNKN